MKNSFVIKRVEKGDKYSEYPSHQYWKISFDYKPITDFFSIDQFVELRDALNDVIEKERMI